MELELKPITLQGVDPTKPIENDSELVASEDEPEEPEEPEETKEPATKEPEEKYEPKPVETREAESFFYSDEGFEDMAFFASWLGAKDFESSEETVDSGMLWFFADLDYFLRYIRFLFEMPC